MIKLRVAMYAGLTVVLVSSGWLARSWYDDSRELVAEKARQAVLSAVQQSVASVAERVETTIAKGRVNERVIDRGIIREISTIEYRDRECFGDELVRLLNLGARGANADVSGVINGEVSRDATRTE